MSHVRMVGGTQHQHIAEVKWRNPADSKVGQSTREQMVTYIRGQKGVVKVTDGKNTVDVGVYETDPPHIQTHADGKWTDNLLALPRF